MKHDKTATQRSKMVITLVAVTVATLLVAATTTQAFSGKNLNSSKSNIYRQSTSQNQNIQGGSGEQVSSNTCTCTSNDVLVNNGNDNG